MCSHHFSSGSVAKLEDIGFFSFFCHETGIPSSIEEPRELVTERLVPGQPGSGNNTAHSGLTMPILLQICRILACFVVLMLDKAHVPALSVLGNTQLHVTCEGSAIMRASAVVSAARHQASPCLLWPDRFHIRLRGGAWEVEEHADNSDAASYDDDYPTLGEAAQTKEKGAGTGSQGQSDHETSSARGEELSCANEDYLDEGGLHEVADLWDLKQGEGQGLWRYAPP